MAASKQSSKHSNTHTHVHNAVSLVWGSLRLTPISDYSASSVIWTLTIRHFDYLNAKFHKSHPHLQKPCGSWRLWNQRGVPKIRIDCWREAGYSQAHGYRSRRFKITYNNVRIQQQNVYYGCLGLQHFLASSMRQVHIQIGTRMRIHSVPVCNMATVLGWNCPCCLRRSEVA